MSVFTNDPSKPQVIYLLEDSKHLRSLIDQFLTMKGYEVQAFDNGKAGELAFRESPGELLITDVIMPFKYGTEVARDLQKDYSALKVIVMTGHRHSENFDLEGTSQFGEFSLIEKPFKLEALYDVVADLIGRPRRLDVISP